MSRTPFYSIDQAQLPVRYWELADRFSALHALAATEPAAVARITVADLLVVLDLCEQTGGALLKGPQGNAVARLRAALEPAGTRGRGVVGGQPGSSLP